MRLWVTVVAAALLLTGCESKAEKEAREQAARVAAVETFVSESGKPAADRLAAVVALQAQTKLAPLLEQDALTLPEGAPEPDFDVYEGNVGMIHVDQPADLSATPTIPIDVTGWGFHWWHAPAALLKDGTQVNGTPEESVDAAKQTFARLAGLRYLLVVRTHELTQAKFADLSEEGSTFVPGMIKGDALLYDLEGGEPLGGVRYAGESSTSLLQSGGDGVQKVLDEDLLGRAASSLSQALEEALPN